MSALNSIPKAVYESHGPRTIVDRKKEQVLSIMFPRLGTTIVGLLRKSTALKTKDAEVLEVCKDVIDEVLQWRGQLSEERRENCLRRWDALGFV